MLQKIEKIGDNFRITIPAHLAEECGIKDDSDIEIKVCNSRIVIQTSDSSFSSLMTHWHEEDCRSEMFFG